MNFSDHWTVRGPADDVGGLLRRAGEFIDSLSLSPHLSPLGGDRFLPPFPVSGLSLERQGDDAVLTISFDHWQLPADLDYLDPRVAGDGHHTEGQRDDVDFIVALAERLDAHAVVDFGCGPGQLAVTLAAHGRQVIGVDPSRAMLDLARRRDDQRRVEWIWGDARALADRQVDLIAMLGNIPSIYVTDEIWDTVLRTFHRSLVPGGHLAFGSWNPTARGWERWGWDVLLLVGAGGSRAVVGSDQRAVVGPVASPRPAQGIELADGRETLRAGSEWRYRNHEELAESLTRCGFVLEATYGDWDRSPLTPTSPYIVIVARRDDANSP
jgi:SAM-dependent methyltransferase